MSGADVRTTAAHTADTPQLLLEHHLKELRLPTILREYDKVARQCAVEQVDYQHYLLRITELELLDRERHRTPHPPGEVPGRQDHGKLRLPRHPVAEQGSGAGTGAMRVPRPPRERSVAGQQRHGENAHRTGSGPRRLPARTPRALHYDRRPGQRVDRGPRRQEVAPLPETDRQL